MAATLLLDMLVIGDEGVSTGAPGAPGMSSPAGPDLSGNRFLPLDTQCPC